MKDAKEYQEYFKQRLINKFGEPNVRGEWRAFSNLPYQYSPIVDIAIGPYSIEDGQTKIDEYNVLLDNPEIKSFLKKIYDLHIENIGEEWLHEINISRFDDLIQKNQNARCFIAIEIENTSTKKHIMGSLINAASLGRIGIGVAYNESVKRTFIRIMNYLAFLKRVGKNTYDTTNFLIITKEQFKDLLDE